MATFILIAIVAAAAVVKWWNWTRSRTSRPLLLPMYAKNVALNPIAHGQIDGLPYALLVGAPSPIMVIDLPFRSAVHIVAFGHVDSNIAAAIRGFIHLNKTVQRVELEGDFSDYFWLYADPAHQVELRQVLDPATMAFLIDFSEENDWELIDNRLFMVHRGPARSQSNDTPTTGDAHAFAQRMLPTLRRMSQASLS